MSLRQIHISVKQAQRFYSNLLTSQQRQTALTAYVCDSMCVSVFDKEGEALIQAPLPVSWWD